MRMPSVNDYSFGLVPDVKLNRSTFNMSHGVKTSFDANYIIPMGLAEEVIPGDTWNVNATLFARLATVDKPFMDNVWIDTFFFFVPNRLVWENWEKHCGAVEDYKTNGASDFDTDFMVPQVPMGSSNTTGTLYDYFGVPTDQGVSVNNLIGRSYNLIYNTWFLDQNLMDYITVDVDDGPDSISDYVLRKRCKKRDYFTSCLPFLQKGDPLEVLPAQIPVIGTGAAMGLEGYRAATPGTIELGLYRDSTDLDAGSTAVNVATDGTSIGSSPQMPDSDMPVGLSQVAANTNVVADISTAVTVNDLRLAFQKQRILEKDARSGSRYVEILKSFFGVTSPDFRHQRPEYLGGKRNRVNVTSVPQTGETGTTPQGNLAGFATCAGVNNGFTKSFTEHGHIIALMNLYADTTYQQSLHRKWSRRTRWDQFWPQLQSIGEQAVLQKEIYCDGVSADDDVFGYQERFAEYKYIPSLVTSHMNSNASSTLHAWHAAEKFTSAPSLDDSFIVQNHPIDRVIKGSPDAGQQCIMDIWFDIKCARPMATYSIPGYIDHF